MERTERVQTANSSAIQVRSVEFYSQALQRPARYLIALPPDYNSKTNWHFPVLFLLHGMDGSPEDWLSKGDLAAYLTQHHLIAVLPDGADSYYTNSVFRSKDRYEDFIVQDLANDVEQHYRVLQKRESRGIGGVSMGGYGAVKIAFRHSDRYAFAAGVSSPLDVTRWPFAPRRLGQSFRLLRIFGPSGGSARRANDVFLLARQTKLPPYVYLACGNGESLASANRQFDALLQRQRVTHEFHESGGGHSWDHWQRELPGLLNAAERNLNAPE